MVYGLRYDFFRSTESSNYSNRPLEADLSGTRLTGLLGWRVLRIQQGYLGLISHFDLGLSTVKYDATTTSSQGVKQTFEYKGKPVPGYGIALEGAYYAEGKFPTGVEIGYTHYGASSFEDANGAAVRDSSGADLKIDLSGLYARFYVGFVF